MSQKQVMPKSEDLSRSLEINAIWTLDTEFPTIFIKSCTYITFKSAVNLKKKYNVICFVAFGLLTNIFHLIRSMPLRCSFFDRYIGDSVISKCAWQYTFMNRYIKGSFLGKFSALFLYSLPC